MVVTICVRTAPLSLVLCAASLLDRHDALVAYAGSHAFRVLKVNRARFPRIDYKANSSRQQASEGPSPIRRELRRYGSSRV